MENTKNKSGDAKRVGNYTVGFLKEFAKEDVRKVWADEARDFTNWMKDESVMRQLGDTLGLELDTSDVKTECKGENSNRRCDIVTTVCDDESDGDDKEVVVIENQLEKTDFSHLGRIILYAATQGANHVVWVVKEVTIDHRRTISWLNDNTTDDLRFYLVEFDVYDLGESRVAAKFHLVEGPDEERKAERSGSRGRKENYDFWSGFVAFANADENAQRMNGVRVSQRARSENWYGISVGTSICNINLVYTNSQIKIKILTDGKRGNAFEKLKPRLGDMATATGVDVAKVEVREDIAQPLFRFVGPKCAVGDDKSVKDAYDWLAGGLSKLVPIIKDALGVRS